MTILRGLPVYIIHLWDLSLKKSEFDIFLVTISMMFRQWILAQLGITQIVLCSVINCIRKNNRKYAYSIFTPLQVCKKSVSVITSPFI